MISLFVIGMLVFFSNPHIHYMDDYEFMFGYTMVQTKED